MVVVSSTALMRSSAKLSRADRELHTMKLNKRIRLGIVMRTAKILRVPVCPHQSYLTEDGTERILLREETGQGGQVVNILSRQINSVGED